MSPRELAEAHALGAAGDESIGRFIRRMVSREYAHRFGDAAPPEPTLKPGPGTKRKL